MSALSSIKRALDKLEEDNAPAQRIEMTSRMWRMVQSELYPLVRNTHRKSWRASEQITQPRLFDVAVSVYDSNELAFKAFGSHGKVEHGKVD